MTPDSKAPLSGAPSRRALFDVKFGLLAVAVVVAILLTGIFVS